MFKIVWNVCILLSVAMLSAVLTNRNNHEEFDNSMKGYIKKSTLTNAMSTCKELEGQFVQYGFSNEDRQYFFCTIKK